MEKEGRASLWVGHAESADALKEFIQTRYTKEGNAIPSPFSREFGIDEYDKDFTEWMFRDAPSRSIRELLKPHSFSDQIAPKIIERVGELLPAPANAVILLHQFDYNGSKSRKSSGGISVSFVGSVSFDPNVD
ncbi:MAG: hypothetical protein JWN24_3763 [Phycisphaerales bacterium]|nr:hypothetical protein [Phycisphaerales bacterium]